MNEAELLELGRELARGRERQAEFLRELAHGPLPLGPDLGEHGHVAAREPRFAADEGEEVVARPPPLPEAAHDPPEVAAKLVQVVTFGYHPKSVIIR